MWIILSPSLFTFGEEVKRSRSTSLWPKHSFVKLQFPFSKQWLTKEEIRVILFLPSTHNGRKSRGLLGVWLDTPYNSNPHCQVSTSKVKSKVSLCQVFMPILKNLSSHCQTKLLMVQILYPVLPNNNHIISFITSCLTLNSTTN